MENKQVLDINQDVKWIGILDYDIVTFDIVMETKYGTTYNSYFINAEKKAIIDTSKELFKDEYLEKVKAVVDPQEIEYIILNHTEPDHSGSLNHLLELAKNATVVGSGNAIRYLTDIVNKEFKSLKVKDGDTLDLGNKTLHFIGAPNLHWPDTIYTYLAEDKILFTCDSFGAHYCDSRMFDDMVENYDDAFKYYFDVILKPYSKFMLKAIDKIKPLDISVVAPGHGPILRSNWKKYVDLSAEYASDYLDTITSDQHYVFLAYISAYGYTKEMAHSIENGLRKAGIKNIEMTDIENIDLGELESAIVKSEGILVGSPTINQNTLLPVYKMFALINPIRDKGKLAGSFGSYGWSGEAVKLIDSHLSHLKLKVFEDGLAEKFYPGQDKEKKFVDFGYRFGKQLISADN